MSSFSDHTFSMLASDTHSSFFHLFQGTNTYSAGKEFFPAVCISHRLAAKPFSFLPFPRSSFSGIGLEKCLVSSPDLAVLSGVRLSLRRAAALSSSSPPSSAAALILSAKVSSPNFSKLDLLALPWAWPLPFPRLWPLPRLWLLPLL